MGIMGSLQIRRPVYTGLLCLLVALASGFSALGFSAWASAWIAPARSLPWANMASASARALSNMEDSSRSLFFTSIAMRVSPLSYGLH